ncbi:hypothetical protein D4R78_01550 [bacterium]|nr:MAG: hypothetical protein D4R78_01550 [bacterium]
MPENKRVTICICAAVALILLALPLSLPAKELAGYDAKSRRDPFIPLVTSDGRLLNLETKADSSSLNLEGIIYDSDDLSYAVVNGEVVKVGDEVNGYDVLKIEKNKVIFIKDSQPMEIELKEE